MVWLCKKISFFLLNYDSICFPCLPYPNFHNPPPTQMQICSYCSLVTTEKIHCSVHNSTNDPLTDLSKSYMYIHFSQQKQDATLLMFFGHLYASSYYLSCIIYSRVQSSLLPNAINTNLIYHNQGYRIEWLVIFVLNIVHSKYKKSNKLITQSRE